MKADYWKTAEYSLVNDQLDFARAKVMAAGLDIGATSSKAVILRDGYPYAVSQVRTRMPQESAFRAINAALDKTHLKLEDISHIVATGCGRGQVPFAHKTITEITCSARGAMHIWGSGVRTVLDIGGQNCRVIRCNEKGRVTAFLVNDKCATGIGRGMEVLADLARKSIAEIGNVAMEPDQFPKIANFCVVYARSEALDLIQSKVPLNQIIAAYHYAMAERISGLVAKLGVKEDFVIVGGLAKNPGIVYWLEKVLEVSRLPPQPEWDPALTSALGAALLAGTA